MRFFAVGTRRAHAPALLCCRFSFASARARACACVFGVTDEPLEDSGEDEQQAEATAQEREGARDRLRGQARRQGGQQVEAKRAHARNEADVLSA